jgi:hypothetical protein
MKRETIVGLIAIVAIVAVVMFAGCISRGPDGEYEKLEDIVNEVRPLIQDCEELGDRPLSIHGKCLIWNIKYDSRSRANDFLYDLEADSADSEITVFLIVDDGVARIGDQTYRNYVDICVVYWPDKKPVGMYHLAGEEFLSTEKVASWIIAQEAIQRQLMVADWIKELHGE